MTILPYFFFPGEGELVKTKAHPSWYIGMVSIVRYSPMSINKYTTNIRREMRRERDGA